MSMSKNKLNQISHDIELSDKALQLIEHSAITTQAKINYLIAHLAHSLLICRNAYREDEKFGINYLNQHLLPNIENILSCSSQGLDLISTFSYRQKIKLQSMRLTFMDNIIDSGLYDGLTEKLQLNKLGIFNYLVSSPSLIKDPFTLFLLTYYNFKIAFLSFKGRYRKWLPEKK